MKTSINIIAVGIACALAIYFYKIIFSLIAIIAILMTIAGIENTKNIRRIKKFRAQYNRNSFKVFHKFRI
jgi:hypothetical protein